MEGGTQKVQFNNLKVFCAFLESFVPPDRLKLSEKGSIPERKIDPLLASLNSVNAV